MFGKQSASLNPAGQGFSPDIKDAARSAATEGVRGKPLRVSPPALSSTNTDQLPSSLEGAWIEIFRAGNYGERGAWTPDDLDRLAASYNPRLQAAPVVLGHPADDAPAFGWVRRLRRAGYSLWAQLEKVDPALDALLRAGRFRQRSVALYKKFPATDGPYLRHVGFLGAAPPAVKGLAPVRFAEGASIAFAFDNPTPSTLSNPTTSGADILVCSGADRNVRPTQTGSQFNPAVPAASSPEDGMPEPKSRLESFLDHLRSFFLAEPNLASGSGDETLPADSPPAFSGRIAALERRLDTLTEAKHATEEKLSEAENARCKEQTANFVETLRSRGRFPPAFDRWGVPSFLERLAQLESQLPAEQAAVASFSDEDEAAPLGPVAWFHEFLTRLPALLEFRELTTAALHGSRVAGHGAPVVRFTEPRRGMTIDPASVALAQRAEALAAEQEISYADALAQLRQEARSNPTTA